MDFQVHGRAPVDQSSLIIKLSQKHMHSEKKKERLSMIWED